MGPSSRCYGPHCGQSMRASSAHLPDHRCAERDTTLCVPSSSSVKRSLITYGCSSRAVFTSHSHLWPLSHVSVYVLLLYAVTIGLLCPMTGAAQTFARLYDSSGSLQIPEHGSGKYSHDKYCEWLIDGSNTTAGQAGVEIELSVISLETECSFDVLSVYEGSDPDPSRLLAVFSGTLPSSSPAVVTSTAGMVLVTFFSDHENNGNGIRMSYTIKPLSTTGAAAAIANGSMNEALALRGAALVGSSVWSFGGLNFRHTSADLVRIDLNPDGTSSSIERIERMNPWPLARHSHQMASIGDTTVYMFGGELANGTLTDELWAFDLDSISSRVVSVRRILSMNSPGPLKHFTFTYIPSTSASGRNPAFSHTLLVFGGVRPGHRVTSSMFAFNLTSRSWATVLYRGLYVEPSSLQLFGHSAIYSDLTHSLYVFGGARIIHPQITRETNTLFIFMLNELVWSKVGAQGAPNPVAFHSAVLHNGNMVVYGGSSLKASAPRLCTQNSVHSFIIQCGAWETVTIAPLPPVRSRHIAVSYGPGMVILGGFDGGRFVNGIHLISLPPPSAVPCSLCSQLTSCAACVLGGVAGSQDMCMWCSSRQFCMESATTTCPQDEQRGSVRECQLEDTGGMVWSLYKCPINYSSPDQVFRTASTRLTWELLSSDYTPDDPRCSPSLSYVKGEAVVHTARFKPHQLEARFKVNHAAGNMSKISLTSGQKKLSAAVLLEFNTSYNNINNKEKVIPDPFPAQSGDFRLEMNSWRMPRKKAVANLIEFYYINTDPFSLDYLSAPALQQVNSTMSCSLHTSCLACSKFADCAWCPWSPASAFVTSDPRSWTLTGSCMTLDDSSVSSDGNYVCTHGAWPVTDPLVCGMCEIFSTCSECIQNPTCDWDRRTVTCVRESRVNKAVRSCPSACDNRTSCSHCLSSPEDNCVWCPAERACVDKVAHLASRSLSMSCANHILTFNQGYSAGLCSNCSQHTSCDSCHSGRLCGWCGDERDPRIGHCMAGGYSGPAGNVKCQENETWSYAQCPDIDQCLLGLASCHADAICMNNLGNYTCHCLPGFLGNGFDECNATCWPPCDKGSCLDRPGQALNCQCELGWTGDRCDVNCGCHGHSTCLNGTGLCDECQGLTEGTFCERCKNNTYGNATVEDCTPCDCNGHSEHACDPTTGTCFSCLHFTKGDHCDQCLSGYYGDPRDGGNCYLEYTGRTLMLNLSDGSWGRFGSIPNKQLMVINAPFYLWVLSVHPDLKNDLPAKVNSAVPRITITLDAINAVCHEESLYITSDPDLAFKEHFPSNRFVNFCEKDAGSVFTSSSGYLVVAFVRLKKMSNFNATYVVTECPGNASSACSGSACETFYLPISNSTKNQTPPVCTNSSRTVPMKRTGAVTAPSPDQSEVFLFGGETYDGRHLNDLWRLDTETGRWEELPQQPSQTWPATRSFAAGTHADGRLWLCGGLVYDSDGVPIQDNSLWVYSPQTRLWASSSIQFIDWIIQPGHAHHTLAGHTLTAIHNTGQLVLLGGYQYYQQQGRNNERFNKHAYIYNWRTANWNKPKKSPYFIGMFFHTADYHQASGVIYCYGGVQHRAPHSEERQSYYSTYLVASSTLTAYNVSSNSWTIIPASSIVDKGDTLNGPTPRFLHSSIITKDYILMIGGISRVNEDAYEYSIDVYSIYCDAWFKLSGDTLSSMKQEYLRHPQSVLSAGRSAFAISPDSSDPAQSLVFGLVGGRDKEFVSRISLWLNATYLCETVTFELDCNCRPGCIWQSNSGSCVAKSQDFADVCTAQKLWAMYNTDLAENSHRCRYIEQCRICLSSLPIYESNGKRCRWLGHSTGGCKSLGGTGGTYEHNPDTCSNEDRCHYGDCDSCVENHECRWSDFITKSAATTVTLTAAWGCHSKWLVGEVQKQAHKVDISVFPDQACPLPCSQGATCLDCVTMIGHSGGQGICFWSLTLNRCLSYAGLLLYGAERGGVSGARIRDQCPGPCTHIKQCALCQNQPRCGWCNATQTCMTGTAQGPSDGVCSPITNQRITPNGNATVRPPAVDPLSQSTDRSAVPADWYFFKCPPENECITGHHNCDNRIEECSDLEIGYDCLCRQDYGRGNRESKAYQKACDSPTLIRADGVCVPLCPQGCVQGCCEAPGVCRCEFGFVGDDCSKECQCNRHSNCSELALDVCFECMNHTMTNESGCDHCEKGYVGDPTANGTCQLCEDFCNKRSTACLPKDMAGFEWKDLNHGPKDPDNTMCLNCQYNSKGDRCEICKPGFYNNPDAVACQTCNCNGHSSMCDESDGSLCQCANNTHSSDEKKADYQCDVCNDNYTGNPLDSHQCYHRLMVDETLSIGDNMTHLGHGDTAFFVVKPKYTNINIHLYVDILHGAVNVYVAKHHQAFQVKYNPDLRQNIITLDYSSLIPSSSAPSSTLPPIVPFPSNTSLLTNEDSLNKHNRSRRSPTIKVDSSNNGAYYWDQITFNTNYPAGYYIVGLEPNTIVKVSEVTARLILTLPHNGVWEKHNLLRDQFYVILEGTKTRVDNSLSQGLVYFRQDQASFNMFIFFTVFFAFIFKILAFCAISWKFRQFYSMQRRQRQHEMQLTQMAARPFVCVDLLLDRPLAAHSKLRARPVGVEFLEKAPACVGTFIFELPGGQQAPTSACFGSTLMATTKERNRQVEALKVKKEDAVLSQSLL